MVKASTRGEPILLKYKGHHMEIEWDLDWHLKIDGHRRGMYSNMAAAENAGRRMIDELVKAK